MKIKNIRINPLFGKKTKDGVKLNKNKGHVLKRMGAIALLVIGLPMLSSCNKQLIDTKYGQNAVLFSGDDSAIIMDIKSWKDYEGEDYQLRLNNGLVTLTASFDTELHFGHSDVHSVRNFAKNQLSENGELHDFYNDEDHIFNYELIDKNWNYNKAVLFNGNKAALFHLRNWKDYEGQQVQIVTDDHLAILLSTYNSKLFYDLQSSMSAEDFAQMYMGKDGQLTSFGTPLNNDSFSNKNLIDLQYNYNKVIIFKDKKALILPVKEWCDYEGEQLQFKIADGPIINTAAYDSLPLDDSRSAIKAYDIASAICDEVVDLTVGKPLSEGFFNKTVIDLVYGFGNIVISNDNSATSLEVNNWKDFEGEQLQFGFHNGDAMLCSSLFIDMVNNGTNDLNADTLADYLGEKVIHKGGNLTLGVGINKQLFDTSYSFNYALHVEKGNVTILPLKSWKDYYNSNGHKSSEYRESPDGTKHKVRTRYKDEEPSPNCEQLQLELPENTCLLTSAYDTALLKTNDPWFYAELFRGKDGVITDLTTVFGKPSTGWNIKLFDTRWNYNYAICNNGVNSQVYKVAKWMDFADGEQVQVYFTDEGGVVSSYVNTTLVSSKDESKVDAIAKAFAGEDLVAGKVYKYYK